jgi:predicted GNAT family acetyltransferase
LAIADIMEATSVAADSISDINPSNQPQLPSVNPTAERGLEILWQYRFRQEIREVRAHAELVTERLSTTIQETNGEMEALRQEMSTMKEEVKQYNEHVRQQWQSTTHTAQQIREEIRQEQVKRDGN